MAVLTDSRGFKGLKQAIKLEFKLARYDQVHRHRRLLGSRLT
jgi:hypothetical protein